MTLRDLKYIRRDELARIRGFGRKAYDVVDEWMRRNGMEYGQFDLEFFRHNRLDVIRGKIKAQNGMPVSFDLSETEIKNLEWEEFRKQAGIAAMQSLLASGRKDLEAVADEAAEAARQLTISMRPVPFDATAVPGPTRD